MTVRRAGGDKPAFGRQTVSMRLYVPATAADLTASSISARLAHGATSDLAAALPEEDEEGLEVSACLCAADSSVLLLAEAEETVVSRRVVIAVDVDAEAYAVLPVEGDVLPGTVELRSEISWDDVAAIFVDEASMEADVRAARNGDEDAFERVADADLLWYDACEKAALAAQLS